MPQNQLITLTFPGLDVFEVGGYFLDSLSISDAFSSQDTYFGVSPFNPRGD